MVNRDVSGLGVDHLNDIDLNDIQQIEIVKGPSSLLYANGTIGGIINVVDNCIAEGNYDKQEFIAGLETQSVNDGDVQHLNYKNNIAGFNVNFGYKNSEFGNFDIPDGAVMHDEDHEGHDEHEEDEMYDVGHGTVIYIIDKDGNKRLVFTGLEYDLQDLMDDLEQLLHHDTGVEAHDEHSGHDHH